MCFLNTKVLARFFVFLSSLYKKDYPFHGNFPFKRQSPLLSKIQIKILRKTQFSLLAV